MIKKIITKYVGNNYIHKEEVKKHIRKQLERARQSERNIQENHWRNEIDILDDQHKIKMTILEEDLKGEIASMQLRIDKINEKEKRVKQVYNNALRQTKLNARVSSDVVYFLSHFKDEIVQCFGLVEGTKDEALRNLALLEKGKKNDDN